MISKIQIFAALIILVLLSAPGAFAGSTEKEQSDMSNVKQATGTGKASAKGAGGKTDTYNGECD